MVVFIQGYFDGDSFLIHFRRGFENGSPCSMEYATLGEIGECIWLLPHSCEFGHSCNLVRVGIPALSNLSQGNHILRLQRVLIVSIDQVKEGVIFYSFVSLVFT